MATQRKQAFVSEKVALPPCGGCDKCGDFDLRHLYALGHNNKYYCKACFHAMAVRWPKPAPYKEPYKKEEE